MGSAAIAEILHHYLGAVAKQKLKERMERKIPEIVGKMLARGMTPENTSLPLLVRDALFRLWRIVIPSGDVADFIRDRQSEKVVALVLKTGGGDRNLAHLVKRTLEALIEVTF